MTTGTGPVPTVAPWQCAQCLGAYGKCIDESDNGHSTTCYGSSETCLYLTKSMSVCLFFMNLSLQSFSWFTEQADGSYTYHRGCPSDYDLNVNFGSDGCYQLNGVRVSKIDIES